MLKNPQHLWHFLDLLKSLKTPRKRFLAVEKDNHCRRTLLTFSLDFFLWTEQNLIQFFAAEYMIDPIWGRGGRVSRSNQADHGNVSQSFLHHLISSLFVGCYQSQAQVRAGSKRARESSLVARALVKIVFGSSEAVVPGCYSSVSASHNIITSLRDTSGRPNCPSLLYRAGLALVIVFAISEVTR